MRVKSMLVIFLCAGAAQAGELRGAWLNNDGVRFFKDQRPAEAYSRFAESLAEIPFEARVHFNLASTYLANQEFEKAVQEFQEAAKQAQTNKDDKTRFASLFNAAVAATELKQIDQALEFYQKCLEINPESVETKTNIELLIQNKGDGGSDDSKDQKDKKDKDGKGDQKKPDQKDGDKKDQPQPNQGPQQPSKNQPKPFKSDNLSQQDVNRIMEELKRQEEEIRVRYQNDKVKDVPRDKDW